MVLLLLLLLLILLFFCTCICMLWFGSVRFGLYNVQSCVWALYHSFYFSSSFLLFCWFVWFWYRLTVFIAVLLVLFCIDLMKGLIAYAQLRHFLFLPVHSYFFCIGNMTITLALSISHSLYTLFGIALAISFESLNCRFVMNFLVKRLTTYITSVVSSRLRCSPFA